MSEDAKKPYGDVEYADPGYQSDKKKRYPVDSAEHCRSAWSYINQSDNAAKYTSEELAHIKAKIKSAAKKWGVHIESSDANGDGDAIECRTAVQLGDVVNNEITYLPSGVHSITPVGGGIGRPINIAIDATTAAEIEHQRYLLQCKGKRPYFDFNHEDGKASFWPESFIWRPGEGVVACGEWSGSGKDAVKSRDFRAFSPVFYVDNKLGNPAKVVCRETAKPNMGGLVNDPAFSNLPLWAKNDGTSVNAGDNGDNQKNKEKRKVSDNEIAALRAKNQELKTRIDELESLVDSGENHDDELRAARAEHETNQTKLQLAASQAIVARQEEELRKNREVKVDLAIRAAVARGAIPPRDEEQKSALRASAMSDESFIKVIDKLPGRSELSMRLVGDSSRYEVKSEDPQKILCKMAEICGKQIKASRADRLVLAREFHSIYARELSGSNANRILGYPLTSVGEALMAGDNTDTNLGILSGTLVAQRVLELLKFTFPALTSFTSDFSDQPAQFKQTIVTRVVTVPNVVTYSTASGWTDSGAVTTDVPVVIDQHKGVPITFNTEILASTVRRLFDEFAEAQSYALGKDMVDALYGRITDANFTNNTVAASTAFTRSTCVDMENALNKRGVPFNSRTLLLWPDAFANLEKDSTLVTFAAFQRPDIIEVGTNMRSKFVIPVASFTVVNAPNLPSNNANLIGFGGSKSALVIAVRPDNDYTSILPGASYGNVAMVTDPDIGMTVTQVQYVNHQLATSTSRISYMYGTAPGQGNAGQLLKANSGSGSSH